MRAEVENSPVLADQVLADDFVGIKADGSSSTKDEILRNLKMREGSPQTFTLTESGMSEHLFGDTACLTYTKVYTLAGGRRTYREQVLHIFTKRNGDWHLQVSSPLPQPTLPKQQ